MASSLTVVKKISISKAYVPEMIDGLAGQMLLSFGRILFNLMLLYGIILLVVTFHC